MPSQLNPYRIQQVRQRRIPPFGIGSTYRPFKREYVNTSPRDGYVNWEGRQITVSEGHPFHSMRGELGMTDLGGPFFTRKVHLTDVTYPCKSWTYRQFVNEKAIQDGHILPRALPSLGVNVVKGNITGVPYPDPFSTDQELVALGTTAIANCSPVKPAVDLSQAFAELFREGLPTLIGMKTLKDRGPKALASEYLNFQFGIMPLWRDIQRTAKAIRNADKLLQNLHDNSGKLVRRRFDFPVEIATTETVIPMGLGKHIPDITDISAYSIAGGMGGIANGTYKVTQTIEKKRWFKGAFTYHDPGVVDSGKWKRIVADADRVYGLRPNVDTLWNLMPWSWLLDWFGNTGDVLQNVAALTEWGQLLRYGYMMETTTCTTTYAVNGISQSRGPLHGELFSYTLVDVTKKRVQATPFGFGVEFDSLNLYQTSILAAIGVSRW
ncbi:TPA_asm: maturation protein [ssRNA phage SRR5467091_11]|uniref:Maturation protein n=1 Tax=ssRNA phage SRR5467091_11 TaxID=2786461 RepID=A0A8S5L484_9VIRU|nr:maturation protein [ssRNA phage SRR5467091_11]DAD52504.1 TPA_asm: maturation protein [ssRNA phage SRR5467091_11]